MTSIKEQISSDIILEDKLLIDPSLIVAKRTYLNIQEELQDSNLGTIYLPSTFIKSLEEGDKSLFNYYLSNAEPISFEILRRDILNSNCTQSYKPDSLFIEKYNPLRSQLFNLYGENQQTQSLFEEWVFLQEESWIISRSKKTFRRLIKSGAIALETGIEAFDALAAKTLKLPNKNIPRSLTSRQRLKATAKWIAVGGSSVTVFFSPALAFWGSIATGSFLLMDP